MLQDMVLAAVNEGLRQAMELQGKATGMGGMDPSAALDALGGLGLGGLGGGGGGGGLPGGGAAEPRGAAQAEVALLAPPVQRLVTELGKLPGIGNRTAQRLAFHLLRACRRTRTRSPTRSATSRSASALCEVCFNLAEGPRCTICADERRDPALICVVEEPGDVIPVERTHEYRGRYHVLGGALSPIDGVEPEDLKIAELYARVERADPPVREVVLATNPTTTGEATALHIADGLRTRTPDVAVTRLASGLPVGGDLEYADEVTLGRAFAGRRAF